MKISRLLMIALTVILTAIACTKEPADPGNGNGNDTENNGDGNGNDEGNENDGEQDTTIEIEMSECGAALFFSEDGYNNHYIAVSDVKMEFNSDGQCKPVAAGHALYLDFYTAADGNWEQIPEGEYKFSMQKKENICLIENTFLLITDDKLNETVITCLVGTVEVRNEDGMYLITVSMTDTEKNEYTITYKGNAVFEDQTPEPPFSMLDNDIVLEATFAKAQHFKDPFNPDVDVVTLLLSTVELDDKGSMTGPGNMVQLMLITDIVPDPEFPFLYPGEYTASSDMNMNTFMTGEIMMDMYFDGSYFVGTDEESNIKAGMFKSGSISILENGLDSYTVSGEVQTAEGKKVEILYEGSIAVEKDPNASVDPDDDISSLTEDRVSDFSSVTTASAEYLGDIYFVGSDIWRITLEDNYGCDVMQFELYAEPGDGSTLPSAEYTPTMSYEYPTFMPGTNKEAPEGTWLLDYSSGTMFAMAPAMDGSVTVTSHGNGEYTISYSFTDGATQPHTFSGEWTGTLEIEKTEF